MRSDRNLTNMLMTDAVPAGRTVEPFSHFRRLSPLVEKSHWASLCLLLLLRLLVIHIVK